jgi:hypothetical protein
MHDVQTDRPTDRLSRRSDDALVGVMSRDFGRKFSHTPISLSSSINGVAAPRRAELSVGRSIRQSVGGSSLLYYLRRRRLGVVDVNGLDITL